MTEQSNSISAEGGKSGEARNQESSDSIKLAVPIGSKVVVHEEIFNDEQEFDPGCSIYYRQLQEFKTAKNESRATRWERMTPIKLKTAWQNHSQTKFKLFKKGGRPSISSRTSAVSLTLAIAICVGVPAPDFGKNVGKAVSYFEAQRLQIMNGENSAIAGAVETALQPMQAYPAWLDELGTEIVDEKQKFDDLAVDVFTSRLQDAQLNGAGNQAPEKQNSANSEKEHGYPILTAENGEIRGIFVQVVSVLEKKQAFATVGRLESQNYEAAIQQVALNDKVYYRVLCGPVARRQEAENLLKQLDKLTYLEDGIFIREIP